MRITIDPMPALREDAERRINQHFDRMWTAREHEHAGKRRTAEAVISSADALGIFGNVPEHFAAAAEIEGMTVQQLAAHIVAQPDAAAERGNQRRRAVVAVRRATTAAEIEAALAAAGVQ